MLSVKLLALVLVALHLFFCLTHLLLEDIKKGSLLQIRRHFASNFFFSFATLKLHCETSGSAFSRTEKEILLFLLSLLTHRKIEFFLPLGIDLFSTPKLNTIHDRECSEHVCLLAVAWTFDWTGNLVEMNDCYWLLHSRMTSSRNLKMGEPQFSCTIGRQSSHSNLNRRPLKLLTGVLQSISFLRESVFICDCFMLIWQRTHPSFLKIHVHARNQRLSRDFRTHQSQVYEKLGATSGATDLFFGAGSSSADHNALLFYDSSTKPILMF